MAEGGRSTMDASVEEISQPVCPERKPCAGGEAPPYFPTQAMAVTKVLDDDNLLREIIVRVGFPNTLVRAALVSKRWLAHASDPKFLGRFRELHPPRLLGYYITGQFLYTPRPDVVHFVPMLPQPPELAAVMCPLKSYNFGGHRIMDCQNNTVFTERLEGTRRTHGVHHPLCAGTDMQIFPPLPQVQGHDTLFIEIISEEEDSIMSYLYVLGKATETRVYKLQDGEWIMRTLATCPHASGYSKIQLPQGVKYRYLESMLSRPDDASSVYLFDVKEFQLCIWLHKGNNWLLLETICLLEMLSTLGMTRHPLEDEDTSSWPLPS